MIGIGATGFFCQSPPPYVPFPWTAVRQVEEGRRVKAIPARSFLGLLVPRPPPSLPHSAPRCRRHHPPRNSGPDHPGPATKRCPRGSRVRKIDDQNVPWRVRSSRDRRSGVRSSSSRRSRCALGGPEFVLETINDVPWGSGLSLRPSRPRHGTTANGGIVDPLRERPPAS